MSDIDGSHLTKVLFIGLFLFNIFIDWLNFTVCCLVTVIQL